MGLFYTTVPKVRKWLRRYQQRGPPGLVELLLRKLSLLSALAASIREFDLPISHRAFQRISGFGCFSLAYRSAAVAST